MLMQRSLVREFAEIFAEVTCCCGPGYCSTCKPLKLLTALSFLSYDGGGGDFSGGEEDVEDDYDDVQVTNILC